MPNNTPQGLPYPLPSEPVADGAVAIRNLAEAVDVRLPVYAAGPIPSGTAAAGTASVNLGTPLVIPAVPYARVLQIMGLVYFTVGAAEVYEIQVMDNATAVRIVKTGGQESTPVTTGIIAAAGTAHSVQLRVSIRTGAFTAPTDARFAFLGAVIN